MLSGSVILTRADTPELVTIVRDLFQEYARALGIDLEYQGFAAELAALPAPYVLPHGALFVAYVDGEVAGCAGLRPLADGAGEMKRLYVRPGYRNLDLALMRRVALSGSKALELRAEVFNATNTPPLGAPNTTVGSAAFGTITSAGDPRVVQLAMKFIF